MAPKKPISKKTSRPRKKAKTTAGAKKKKSTVQSTTGISPTNNPTYVRGVADKYRPLLLLIPGVVSVSAGVKQENGLYGHQQKQPNKLCVIVSVKQKFVQENELHENKTIKIPKTLDGVWTDVIEIVERGQSLQNNDPPLIGGLEIGAVDQQNQLLRRGTLGLVVGDQNNNDAYLTCAHVCYDMPSGIAATAIVQPATAGTATSIGTPSVNGLILQGGYDAALISPVGNRAGNRGEIVGQALPVRDIPLPPSMDMQVEIFGAVSKNSLGIIVEPLVQDPIFFSGANQLLGRLFKISTNNPDGSCFAVAGDSGSLVYAPQGDSFEPAPIGLLVGTATDSNGQIHLYGQPLATFGGVNGIVSTLQLKLS